MMEATILVKTYKVLTLFFIVLVVLSETSDAARNKGYFSDGLLHSRDYPNGYPDNFEEYWKFQTSEDDRLKIVFHDFQVAKDEECRFDTLTVYDGNTKNSPILGKFCGDDIPQPILTKSTYLYMIFKTDGSKNGKGFKASVEAEYNTKKFFTDESERNMTNYFLKTKRKQTSSINKWGTDITRSAVALFLYDPLFFKAGNKTGEEIAYELTLQLVLKLVTKKQVSTTDLALFINAMTVSCINPKNFFGLNLVAELRMRVDNSNATNPFFLLTLCLGGDNMKREDVGKLQILFDANVRPSWTDTQAMTYMALICIKRQNKISISNTDNMILQLHRKQQNNGTVENLKTTALVVQAGIAADIYRSNFNMSSALKSIVYDLKHTEVGFEEMYYILPIIKWKTLLHINSNHCSTIIQTDLEGINDLHKEPDERIQINISIIIGDGEDLSRTFKINVKAGSSLYQALENVSSSEPDYKVQYTVIEGKPFVADVKNFKNSVEDGSFWFIYTRLLSSSHDPMLVEDSPVDIVLDERTEVILWYRSESMGNIQDVFSTTLMDSTTTDSTDTEASTVS